MNELQSKHNTNTKLVCEITKTLLMLLVMLCQNVEIPIKLSHLFLMCVLFYEKLKVSFIVAGITWLPRKDILVSHNFTRAIKSSAAIHDDYGNII